MKEKTKHLKEMAQTFEKAREIAAGQMKKIIHEHEDIEAFMVMAMIEAGIDTAVSHLGPIETAELLRDIADQIEEDADEEGDGFDTDNGDEEEDDFEDDEEDYEDGKSK